MRTSLVLLLWVSVATASTAESEVASESRAPIAAVMSNHANPNSTSATTPPSRWRLGMALGYGARTNPLIQSDDVPIILDVDIAWFGERFFFDNGDLGVTVADYPAMTLNLVGRVNSDRVFFGKTDTRLVRFGTNGQPLATLTELRVPDRDYAVEAGVEMLFDGPWGMLQLAAHHDVSGTHGGFEARVEYSRGWRGGRWYIEPSLGIGFKSRALNDYYWGVRADEANEALPVYRASAGFNPYGRVTFGYHLTRHWSVSLVTEYERQNGEAAASPIVADRDILGYFAGIGYRF